MYSCTALFALLLAFWPAASFADEASPATGELRAELRASVTMLAETIGERNCYRPDGLARAVNWIETEFQKSGYEVIREFVPTDDKFECRAKTENIIAELKGKEAANEILVVGAHYDSKVATPGWHDHLPILIDEPGTPGADDNASGVAAMLAIAKRLSGQSHNRTIRFVAFVNEEPPFFKNMKYMGSGVHASAAAARKEKIVGMISLETLGVYSKQPNSKRKITYGTASLVGLVEKPDYVAFLSTWGSCGFQKKSAKLYNANATVKLRTLCVPRLWGISAWSDDWAFWEAGYDAFTVTDTAYLRHEDYHEVTDTPNHLDYEPFAQVVRTMQEVIEKLAKSVDK